MKKNLTIIAACVLLASILAVSCNGNDDVYIPEGTRLNWIWEIADDSNPTQFAPGISTLHGWEYHPTKFSQAFVLNEPYVRGDPTTGWFSTETVAPGIRAVVTENARGYNPTLQWPDNRGAGEHIRMKVPQTVRTMGPHGEEVDAFNFHGTLVQKGTEPVAGGAMVARTGVSNPLTQPIPPGSTTDYRLGAGWPSITLYATPPGLDEDPQQLTRQAFLDGYGYTFWVRSANDFVAYRTSVENWDYRPNVGHEPGHWFGVRPGRDGNAAFNFTPAPVGQWTQVMVIYDPNHPDFNMGVNNWIFDYSIQENFPGDREPYDTADVHNKDHSIRIAWAFQLQHNGGNEGGANIEYSVSTGFHDFDVYIYGLEILQY